MLVIEPHYERLPFLCHQSYLEHFSSFFDPHLPAYIAQVVQQGVVYPIFAVLGDEFIIESAYFGSCVGGEGGEELGEGVGALSVGEDEDEGRGSVDVLGLGESVDCLECGGCIGLDVVQEVLLLEEGVEGFFYLRAEVHVWIIKCFMFIMRI